MEANASTTETPEATPEAAPARPTCKIRWVMEVARAKAVGLPRKAPGPDDFPLNPTWCYTEHEHDEEATHEVRLTHESEASRESARRICGRDTDGWLPACAAHAEYSRTHLPNWEERPLVAHAQAEPQAAEPPTVTTGPGA